MLLSFDAKQKLQLSVTRNKEYLSKYLLEEERVVGAMLDSKKLVPEGEGRYKYTVTSFKVFQLDINPVVSIAVENKDGILLGVKSRVQQQLVKDFLDWCKLNKI